MPGGKRGGGKCTVNIHEVVNGVMYVPSTGYHVACPSEGGVDKNRPRFPAAASRLSCRTSRLAIIKYYDREARGRGKLQGPAGPITAFGIDT